MVLKGNRKRDGLWVGLTRISLQRHQSYSGRRRTGGLAALNSAVEQFRFAAALEFRLQRVSRPGELRPWRIIPLAQLPIKLCEDG
jgi:hypothetical protein